MGDIINIEEIKRKKPEISKRLSDENLIDFAEHKSKRAVLKAKVYDCDELHIMTNKFTIEGWIAMLENFIEEEYDLTVGGPKFDAMFNAIEAILTAFLIDPKKPAPERA